MTQPWPEGIVDPQRALLSGGSWGGFLTLLGLGTQPERWAAGIAEVPVADYLAAWRRIHQVFVDRGAHRSAGGAGPVGVGRLRLGR